MQLYFTASFALTLLFYALNCNVCNGARVEQPPSSRTSNKIVLTPTEAALTGNFDRPLELTESKVMSEGEAQFVQFLDSSTGWIGTSKLLYKTSDGGTSWERFDLNLPPNSYVSGFSFVSATKGWLAVTSKTEAQPHGLRDSTQIMVTRDCGKSWSEQALFENDVTINDLRFANSDDGMAIGHKVISDPQSHEQIFAVKTADGGQTWVNISDRLESATKNEFGKSFASGASISWLASSQIFVLTRQGQIIASKDSGLTWERTVQLEDERPDKSISSTGYYKIVLDTEHKIRIIAGAMGQEGYWGDLILNGASDSWVNYELLRTPIHDVVFLSTNEFVACGQEILAFDETTKTRLPPSGIILHSLDGGKTWSPVYRSKASGDFISITKAGDRRFFAVSDTGTFVRFSLSNN